MVKKFVSLFQWSYENDRRKKFQKGVYEEDGSVKLEMVEADVCVKRTDMMR